MSTLTVGSSQQYSSIAAAVAAARDGDTVAVASGTYVNDFATIRTKITLTAVGGTVTLLDTATMASGQGVLTVAADATVSGFVVRGAHSADGTAAGIAYQAGALTLVGSLLAGNQVGLAAGAAAAGTIAVQASEFAGNGANLLVGAVKSLQVTGSYIHDAASGDEVRSLAAATTVTGSRILDNAGAGAIGLDLPTGGTAVLQNDVIEKGANSTASQAVQFGGGVLARFSTLSVTGTSFVSDRAASVALKNQSTSAAVFSGNRVFGFATVVSGLSVSSGTVVASTRPAVSTAALVVPSGVPAVEYGRVGAVVASGRVLQVGPGAAYATLAAAVAAAADGDTINVAAGTYVNDTAVIGHKVVIQGVGGLARFVATAATGAVLTTTTDVTLRNVEVFGASGAAVHATGGNLTVVNSTLHDNQAGVVAETGVATVGLYDTEIAANGAAGGGGNLVVGEVGTLTLRNDYVHGGVAGPEIVSAADNTVLDGDRVSQAAGNTAAPVALPDGGVAVISNSAIQKGAAASGSAAVVLVGGGAAYPASSVTLANDVLISQVTAAKTTFVANPAAMQGVTVSGTTFVGGASGSVQVQNGTDTGAVVAASGTVNTVSPWGATGAPAAAALLVPVVPGGAAQAGQIVLRVSEAAWRGDAQFSLLVDGAAVAGVLTATASHAAGQAQAFTIAGPFAPGAHTVSVRFLNSLSGTDGARALFVDGMSFNGQDSAQSAVLGANGTALLSTAPTTQSTAVTVSLSETAMHGDALAFISIDGKVQGGVQTVSASHAAGATQAMSFLLDLAPGGHTAAVTMLNAATGRALFVDAIDVAGQHYAAAAATLAAGSSTFGFTVAPAPAANGALFVTAGAPTALAGLVPVS